MEAPEEIEKVVENEPSEQLEEVVKNEEADKDEKVGRNEEVGKSEEIGIIEEVDEMETSKPNSIRKTSEKVSPHTQFVNETSRPNSKPSADTLLTTPSTARKFSHKEKMYNVALQVRPKELDNYDDKKGIAPSKKRKKPTKYYRNEKGELATDDERPRVRENSQDVGVGPDEDMFIDQKPKMYDVSLGVGVAGGGGITKEMLSGTYGQDFGPLTDEERGIRKKRYDVACACGPQEITPAMLLGDYGQDFSEELDDTMLYTTSEYEMKLLLERKESRRHDAITLSRPAGYRELELSTQSPQLTQEVGLQVNEFEVEQDLAEARNIKFPPKVNTLWPTNEEFDKEKIVKRIEDYINRCWSLDPNWQFHIEYVQKYCHDHTRQRYVYEVKFSLPTVQNPVPATTASVYFIIDVPFFEKYADSVKVHYVVEGTRFKHTPGTVQFQQRWLRGIIVEKTKMQRLVDF